MLTRAGVSKWLLADDDLLLPDNFVRNELDRRDAGSHKASALARRMEYINPAVDTNVWHIQLGTQTASASAEAILRLLGECDLIIDATANPDALNIISAVTMAKQKPVIWAEVFGGGIGGLMARYRPGLDPSPQLMRRAIENWFRDQIAPPVRNARSYETGAEEAPLIANDADVSVIAANAARFAIDLLARPASSFPHSVYAIGLGVGSVFTEPFDTRPIDVGLPPAEAPKPQLSEAEAQAEMMRLLDILKPKADEAPAAPTGNQAPAA
jgi:sulfur-carrier protein adenylyltransferase/sulfurtransferase